LSKLEECKSIGELKTKINNLDFEVLNVTVLQNLSSVQTENDNISDFPIISQTNGTVLF